MFYRVIGIMSGSSLDGLDIAYAEFEETGGVWNFDISAAVCKPYNDYWAGQLKNAIHLAAYDYLLLHTAYGKFIGKQVNSFIDEFELQHKVQLIASHGHTTFHAPQLGMTAQLGDGAAIAAVTEINTVSDLRAIDVAHGGQGAPIVPIGEKLLFSEYTLLLNIGGIANLTINGKDGYIAFDVCPANQVLNLLAQLNGKAFDDQGTVAASGDVNETLLTQLNLLAYYSLSYPKSLANTFGTGEVFPLIQSFNIPVPDKLRTFAEHIVMQVRSSIEKAGNVAEVQNRKLLVTGGGAFNTFLVGRLTQVLQPLAIEVEVPADTIINYKEALIMGLIGVLRWREEYNVLSTVTGARRSSIGGAVWIGQEA